jgi:hypothetical protein
MTKPERDENTGRKWKNSVQKLCSFSCVHNRNRSSTCHQQTTYIEEGRGNFFEKNVPHYPCKEKLAQIDDRDCLPSKVFHRVVERRVADDRRNDSQPKDCNDVFYGVRLYGVDKKETHTQTKDSCAVVERHEIKPDALCMPVGSSECEVQGEEYHRNETDEISDEKFSAESKVDQAEKEHARNREPCADDLPPVEDLFCRDVEEKGHDSGNHVHNQRRVCRQGEPGPDIPRDKVNCQSSAWNDGGEDGIDGELSRMPFQVTEKERCQYDRRYEKPVGGEEDRVFRTELDEDYGHCAGEHTTEKDEEI